MKRKHIILLLLIAVTFLGCIGPKGCTAANNTGPGPTILCTPPAAVFAENGVDSDRIKVSWSAGSWTYDASYSPEKNYKVYRVRSLSESFIDSPCDETSAQLSIDCGIDRSHNLSLYPGIYYYKVSSWARLALNWNTYYYEGDLSTAYAQGSITTFQITNFNLWIIDNIGNQTNAGDIANQNKWYWFSASNGQKVTVYWDEVTNGTATYTADIEVYAYKVAIETCTNDWNTIPSAITYYGEGKTNNGYTVGGTFVSSDNGKVYIYVTGLRDEYFRGYKFGTFALKVSNW
ncbi:MAG: hypothetical protein HZC28_16060 [Spirochaetes bacterium]|nr:hypothetical protein [Spirochaetota bacterium]